MRTRSGNQGRISRIYLEVDISIAAWYQGCFLTHLRSVQFVHKNTANVTSCLPTSHNERIIRAPAVSFHPDRQRHQPCVTNSKVDQARPESGLQVGWIIIGSKDWLPMLPQCHQIVVCLTSQRFEVDALDKALSA